MVIDTLFRPGDLLVSGISFGFPVDFVVVCLLIGGGPPGNRVHATVAMESVVIDATISFREDFIDSLSMD